MEYDAVNVGSNDLVHGIDFLTGITQIPFTSSSFYTSDNTPVFPPFLVKGTGTYITAIIGISRSPEKKLPAIVHKQWQEVFPQLMVEVEKKADVIVLLSELPMAENRAIAQAYPQIKIIITALSASQNMKPEIIHNTLITQTAHQGKYLGFLRLLQLAEQGWYLDRSDEINRLKQTLKPLEYRIKRLEAITIQTTQQKDLYLRLSEQKKELLKSIQDAKNSGKMANDQIGSRFFSQFFALTENMPDDEAVVEMVDSINAETKAANMKQQGVE